MGITYYDTGTATLSVGSKTMTGQGTLWAGWVKPGDQVMPEEGTNNVVDVVVSNTEITLLKQYRGVAQAARPYTIMRTPDVVFTESLARTVLQGISGSALLALSDLVAATRKGIRFGATGSAETFPLEDFALTFLDDPDAISVLRTLGLNSLFGQTSAPLRLRGGGDQIETGHINQSGYGGAIGVEAASGQPYLVFFGGAGSTANTYRTRGFQGIGILGKTNGSLDFISVPALNADNQTAVAIAGIDASGMLRIAGEPVIDSLWTAAGGYIRFAKGIQICFVRASCSLNSNSFQTFSYPAAFSTSAQIGLGHGLAQASTSGDNGAWWDGGSRITLHNVGTTQGAMLYRGPLAATYGYVYITATGFWR